MNINIFINDIGVNILAEYQEEQQTKGKGMEKLNYYNEYYYGNGLMQ